MSEDPALFDVPVAPREAPKLAAKPKAPRYARYRPADRVHCDDCTRAIHELGVFAAPYPRRARWRRTVGDGSSPLHLCDDHKNRRIADD